MQQTHISGVDLKLLPALDALLRHRNVTRAAHEVHLSQPAMSRVLARLRHLQSDPLLVRKGAGYVLTARAKEIQPQVAAAIRNLQEVFRRHAFDPSHEKRVVRLAAADAQAIVLLPGIAARLATDAPGIDLRVEPYRADTLERLERGAIDLMFALANTPLPTGAYSEVVSTDRLALVMRAKHPAANKKWTVADYAKYSHVGVALTGDGRTEIDTLLAAKGVTRRMALVTPYFMAALTTVAATNAVTTISAAFAGRYARALRLVMKTPPFGDSALVTTLVCSGERANDPLLTWLRALIRNVAPATRV
jgi:DNA-binding transcriptional LysR family regulator